MGKTRVTTLIQRRLHDIIRRGIWRADRSGQLGVGIERKKCHKGGIPREGLNFLE